MAELESDLQKARQAAAQELESELQKARQAAADTLKKKMAEANRKLTEEDTEKRQLTQANLKLQQDNFVLNDKLNTHLKNIEQIQKSLEDKELKEAAEITKLQRTLAEAMSAKYAAAEQAKAETNTLMKQCNSLSDEVEALKKAVASKEQAAHELELEHDKRSKEQLGSLTGTCKNVISDLQNKMAEKDEQIKQKDEQINQQKIKKERLEREKDEQFRLLEHEIQSLLGQRQKTLEAIKNERQRTAKLNSLSIEQKANEERLNNLWKQDEKRIREEFAQKNEELDVSVE